MWVWDKAEGVVRGYSQMAADEQRERAALEWCNALIDDLPVATLDETTQHD